jgi:hypothetical protein
MANLFRRFFSDTPLYTASFMWWDLVVETDVYAKGDPEEYARVREAIFATLCDILGSDSEHCQRAALHGLNHLRHPRTQEVVDGFLGSHPDLAPALVTYAQECREGRAP